MRWTTKKNSDNEYFYDCPTSIAVTIYSGSNTSSLRDKRQSRFSFTLSELYPISYITVYGLLWWI